MNIDSRLLKDLLRAAGDGAITGLATVLCYALIGFFYWLLKGVDSPSNPPNPVPVRLTDRDGRARL